MNERMRKDPGDFNPNDRIINDIVNKVAGLMITTPGARSIDFATATEPILDLNDEDALYEDHVRRMAFQAIETTKTRAYMRWAAREINNGTIDESTVDSWESIQFPALLSGEHSSFIRYGEDPRKILEVGYTVIELEGEGVSKEVSVDFSDELISSRYNIRVSPDQTSSAVLNVVPVHDELLEKIMDLQATDMIERLMPLMIGMTPKDEDEVDSRLDIVRKQYASTPYEEEMNAILEEVRERYVTVRQSREMNKEFGHGEVAFQELTELRDFIDRL